jgi:DNA repair protein RecN (Recombination protein N)
MLKRLNIRNYALIDHLEIEFSNHLTIITGETGAGKSIVLGALGLIMGERADSKSFYDVTEKCIIEATFDVEKYDLIAFFTEHELDYETEMCIRREVSPTGKSRAFVNDTPVNNQVLQRITESLIDLHQQFDTLDIHHVNFQLRMVDALADNQKLLKTYQSDFRKYASDRKRLSELINWTNWKMPTSTPVNNRGSNRNWSNDLMPSKSSACSPWQPTNSRKLTPVSSVFSATFPEILKVSLDYHRISRTFTNA